MGRGSALRSSDVAGRDRQAKALEATAPEATNVAEMTAAAITEQRAEFMASVLSFKDVSKSYKRGKESVAVLDHFNLEIAENDFVAIMGPSGSGKTTLLNLIGGLDRPSGGEITVAGERLDQLSGSALANWRARHVGF